MTNPSQTQISRIFAVHLLNDFSGSPKVFAGVLQTLANEQHDIRLYTSSTEGFLSKVTGINRGKLLYVRPGNRWLRLVSLLVSQLFLFVSIFFRLRGNDILYVNTILPFGALMAGKLRKKRVICHVHETSVTPPVLKKFLRWTVNQTATEVIFVSNYLRDAEEMPRPLSHVVYNAIDPQFTQRAQRHQSVFRSPPHILMLCSLRAYKGVNEFISLARRIPDCSFDLVLNATPAQIEAYFKGVEIPSNVSCHPAQKEVHSFYQKAHLVLNLSRPDGWIETFGLTALEAMSYSLPVIVPPVGGIAELVEQGVHGFKIDSRDIQKLEVCIRTIRGDHTLYERLSTNARRRSKDFNFDQSVARTCGILLAQTATKEDNRFILKPPPKHRNTENVSIT